MLRQLTIRDYVLVRHVSLEFEAGLTALTGETGAGKSMVFGALDVLLGERFPKDAVAPGAERAVIEGTFYLREPDLLRGVIAAEDEAEDRHELLLRREITNQGRTRSWLNDHPVPQETLLKLRDLLADFHGQREHQSLFKSARQLEYLDIFADTLAQATKVRGLYETRVALKRELAQAQAALEAHRKDRALLEYQLEEIERLGLKAGEDDAIDVRLRKLESAEKLAFEAARLLALLTENDPSLVTLAGLARNAAAGIAKVDPDLAEVTSELAEINSRLKDLATQVQDYQDGLSFDEIELERLRERRTVLWDLRRKHGMSIEQVLDRAGELKTLLAQGETLERRVAELQAELDRSGDAVVNAAEELSQRRHVAAADFSARVLETLKPLGLPAPQFEAALQTLPAPLDPERLSADGADRIEFLFSANPGKKPVPIREVASGGESSRVTLAIKSALSEKAEYPMMVYDEIDLGISGRVADQVGRALVRLARRHQVLCITHLPQIASRADHHLAVNKTTRGQSAETTARFLSEADRVQAIASLIAGEKVTDQSLATASELLRQSGKL